MDPAVLKQMGINLDVFGDGNAYSDPSWYLSFYSENTVEAFKFRIRSMIHLRIKILFLNAFQQSF